MRINQWLLYSVMQRVLLLLRQLRAQVRNHHVVAGQYAMTGTDGGQFVVANVSDLHFFRGRARPHVPSLHHSAVETDLRRRYWLVQMRVVGTRGHNVLHRAAGHASRDKRTNEQARYGGVAVGEMKNV